MVEIFSSNIWRILHRIFLGLVMTYGIILVCCGISFSLYGQSKDDLERRVTKLEDQNLEHRVTVMETILADLQNSALWQRLNMGGTGLLIAEAVTRTVKRKVAKSGIVDANGN